MTDTNECEALRNELAGMRYIVDRARLEFRNMQAAREEYEAAWRASEARIRVLENKLLEMAEERHLLHGKNKSAFWNCSRACCKDAAQFLRSQSEESV